MPTIFEFEKPVIELENKINELRNFAQEKNLNLDEEITTLERRLLALKVEIYGNLTPWQKVLMARHPERPSTRDYIQRLFTDFIELHGDRCFGDDPAVIGGIGRFDGLPVTIVGHQKGRGTKENLACNFGMAHPEGCRKALRLMCQAEKFRRPVISFIDTPGAHCGIGAEERGQAEAIARNIRVMSTLKTPIIVVVVGEGGSGGALALGVGDCILMQEHAVFSVSSAEACASILWKDASRAREAADALKLTADDLLRFKVIDEIVPEPLGGAHRQPAEAAEILRKILADKLKTLRTLSMEELIARRYERFRSIGSEFLQEVT